MGVSAQRPVLNINKSKSSDAYGETVIFIHGILSGHETFEPMLNSFNNDKDFNDWNVGYFDYNFWQKMTESASQLNKALEEHVPSDTTGLTLVCHSMGGLIARLAVILRQNPLPSLKRIVMLGTPNFGAIRSAQLAILAQMTFSLAGCLWGTFTRKTGVLDLRNVDKQFDDVLNKGGNPTNARDVEYITIPGLYFHEGRNRWESPSRRLTVLNVGLDLFLPSAAIRISRPHDGIVEESSVSMLPSGSNARWSEKDASITDRNPPTYAHIAHATRNRELTHVMIHRDEKIIDMIKGILLSGSVQTWRDSLGRNREYYIIKT
jgi:pimeloyl-ACP methyl ester carboxylesterase